MEKSRQYKWSQERQSKGLCRTCGKDAVEIHKDAIHLGEKVLLIDDLIATGGTARAAAKLIEKLGGKVEEIAFVIELPDLKGREKLNHWEVYSVVKFEGE